MKANCKFTSMNDGIIIIVSVTDNIVKYKYQGSTNIYSMNKNAFITLLWTR